MSQKQAFLRFLEGLQPIADRSDEEQKLAEIEIAKKIAANDKNDESVLDNWDEFLLTSFEQTASSRNLSFQSSALTLK